MVVVRLVLLLEAPLAPERQDVVLDGQLEVLPVHSGQLGFENDLVLVLVDVNVRRPSAARDALLAEGAGEARREEAVDLVLQSFQVAEWVVTCDAHTSTSIGFRTLCRGRRPAGTGGLCW